MGEEVEDLVERLNSDARTLDSNGTDGYGSTPLDQPRIALLREAAATIESLRASLTRVEEERDADGFALEAAAAWLERWAAHVGNCRGGAECTCGLTAIRRDVQARCLSRASPTETERSE